MKHINKHMTPKALEEWKRKFRNSERRPANYKDLNKEVDLKSK